MDGASALSSHMMKHAKLSLQISLSQGRLEQKKTTEIHTGAEEKKEVYEKKHILSVLPSTVLAKNMKEKDPVFALINQELIEGFSTSLFA